MVSFSGSLPSSLLTLMLLWSRLYNVFGDNWEARTSPKIIYSTHQHPASSLPYAVDYALSLNGSTVILRLTKNEQFDKPPPIYYLESGQLVLENSSDAAYEGLAFYQDITSLAAVSLKIKPGRNNDTHEINGIIYVNDSMYRIQSAANQSFSDGRNGDTTGSHMIRKVARQNLSSDYIVPSRRHAAKKYNNDLLKGTHLQGARRRKRTTQAQYEIDQLYVTDYSMFQSFSNDVRSKNSQATTTDVLRAMRYYLSHVENAVDVRYRSINSSSWIIRTRLVAFYMVTTQAASSWTETLKGPAGPSGQVGVDAGNGLDNFKTWVTSASSPVPLPNFDHTALFTGYDLYMNSTGTADFGVVGLAFLSGLCGDSRESIIEFTGGLTEGQTQAHELGHSLSSEHDGDGNACQAASQYIMTAVTTAPTSGNELNYFKFSNCSIAYFNIFIDSMTRSNTNCMTNTEDYFNSTEWFAYMTMPPGQAYSVNDQCKQLNGPNFEACGGPTFGKQVCTVLYCYNTSTSSGTTECISSDGGRGLDGTTCGNHSWCQEGNCVYHASAPAASDSCPIGDFSRTAAVYANQPFTCSNMPAYYCYDQSVYQKCCGTCSRIINASRVGCEYGDKLNCSGATILSCNSSQNRLNCCNTCEILSPSTTSNSLITTTSKNSAPSSGSSVDRLRFLNISTLTVAASAVLAAMHFQLLQLCRRMLIL